MTYTEISHQPGAWEVHDQVEAHLVPGEGSLHALQKTTFPLCPHVMGGGRGERGNIDITSFSLKDASPTKLRLILAGAMAQ